MQEELQCNVTIEQKHVPSEMVKFKASDQQILDENRKLPDCQLTNRYRTRAPCITVEEIGSQGECLFTKMLE